MRSAQLGVDQLDTIICDIDGVILLGAQPIPGARAALEKLRRAGLDIVFATNNSTRKPDVVREHVQEVVGFDPGPDAVVTSGAATAEWIAGEVEKVLVVGTDGLRDTLQDCGVEVTRNWKEADAVVVGLDPAVTYEALAHAGLAIQNGATFYATNTDASYPRPDGLHPGAGALVAAIATTTGREPAAVCGKPHAPMRRALANRNGRGAGALVVGDRPDTDIALGKAEGWATVLTLTGVVGDKSEIPDGLEPDIVINSIADLPDLLGLY